MCSVADQRSVLFHLMFLDKLTTTGTGGSGFTVCLPSCIPHATCLRWTGTAIHVVGRAFPSCGGPIPSRHAPQPYPPSAWTNPDPLPQFTPVTGSYRPPYQLPRLIAQVQQRSSPANDISRPRTADPYGVSSSRYTHHRQQ
ncbi:hypothetical protein OH76DRAFT_1395616 [Lentinus brumalis]|uniref:Uncharacterized protein n=1 Tax=Lentinus brumalis TaxID=2498619 RepID=A0A371DVJ5_9APHY|nr:hypothetical protein OH76DRAFT_1395616 [Polyporus brumalis]